MEKLDYLHADCVIFSKPTKKLSYDSSCGSADDEVDEATSATKK